MNIGYFFNGFLGDKLTEASKDTPDGNAWYSSSIIEHLIENNHNVFKLGIDKDKKEYSMFSSNIFSSFEKNKRLKAYLKSKQVTWIFEKGNCFIENKPKLDLIILEWRFPIVGRNTKQDINTENFQYDLLMQEFILNNYSCPIIVFDLDYKITLEDEEKLRNRNVLIIETSNNPKKGILERMSIEIPFWVKSSNITQNKSISKYKDLVYIGSRYERDRCIQEYLIPYSEKELYKVWFYGNWRKYKDKYDELYTILNWRNIQYHDRVGHEHFNEIYSDSVACPLLAKDDYFHNGFMTARIQECLYFGSIPIGFKEHFKIEKYLPDELIVDSSDDLYNKIAKLKKMSITDRNNYRNKLWKHLEFMDVSNFIKIILKV